MNSKYRLSGKSMNISSICLKRCTNDIKKVETIQILDNMIRKIFKVELTGKYEEANHVQDRKVAHPIRLF